MRIKRDIILMFSSITAVFIVLQTVFAVVCSRETTMESSMDYWFSNVFRDKIYVFILIPIYFLAASYVDRFFSISTIVRINDRKKSIWIGFKYKLEIAFILVSEWFIMVAILSIILFDMTQKNITNYILGYFCYLLGLIASVTTVEIFKRSEVKLLNSNPYFFTNALIIFEITVLVPTLSMNTPFKYPIFFCWVFDWNMRGIVALTLIESALAVYLFKVSSGKDII